MPPLFRLIPRFFQSNLHVHSQTPSFSQGISFHRVVMPRVTKPTIRSFSTRSNFSRPKLLQYRHQFTRRFNSSKSNPSSSSSSSSSSSNPGSLSQRLRKLSREYGWSALGVYLFLSALDFPFCFAAVRLLGVERIGHYEHVIVEGAKSVLAVLWPFRNDTADSSDMGEQGSPATYDNGAAGAEKRRSEDGASMLPSKHEY